MTIISWQLTAAKSAAQAAVGHQLSISTHPSAKTGEILQTQLFIPSSLPDDPVPPYTNPLSNLAGHNPMIPNHKLPPTNTQPPRKRKRVRYIHEENSISDSKCRWLKTGLRRLWATVEIEKLTSGPNPVGRNETALHVIPVHEVYPNKTSRRPVSRTSATRASLQYPAQPAP